MTTTNKKNFLKQLLISKLKATKEIKSGFIRIFKFSSNISDIDLYITYNKITRKFSIYQDSFLLTEEDNTCRIIFQKLLHDTKNS